MAVAGHAAWYCDAGRPQAPHSNVQLVAAAAGRQQQQARANTLLALVKPCSPPGLLAFPGVSRRQGRLGQLHTLASMPSAGKGAPLKG